MTVLLDTSVIIDLLRERPRWRDFLEEFVRHGHTLACCAVNWAEVYAGMRSNEAETTADLFSRLEYVQISREAARGAGELIGKWRRKGKTLNLPDALIGAVAFSEGLALATDNVRDFPLPGLKFVSPPRVQ